MRVEEWEEVASLYRAIGQPNKAERADEAAKRAAQRTAQRTAQQAAEQPSTPYSAHSTAASPRFKERPAERADRDPYEATLDFEQDPWLAPPPALSPATQPPTPAQPTDRSAIISRNGHRPEAAVPRPEVRMEPGTGLADMDATPSGPPESAVVEAAEPASDTAIDAGPAGEAALPVWLGPVLASVIMLAVGYMIGRWTAAPLAPAEVTGYQTNQATPRPRVSSDVSQWRRRVLDAFDSGVSPAAQAEVPPEQYATALQQTADTLTGLAAEAPPGALQSVFWRSSRQALQAYTDALMVLRAPNGGDPARAVLSGAGLDSLLRSRYPFLTLTPTAATDQWTVPRGESLAVIWAQAERALNIPRSAVEAAP